MGQKVLSPSREKIQKTPTKSYGNDKARNCGFTGKNMPLKNFPCRMEKGIEVAVKSMANRVCVHCDLPQTRKQKAGIILST